MLYEVITGKGETIKPSIARATARSIGEATVGTGKKRPGYKRPAFLRTFCIRLRISRITISAKKNARTGISHGESKAETSFSAGVPTSCQIFFATASE